LEIKNQEMKTKFGWKYYFSPTPKRLRVLGDSLAIAGTFALGIATLNGHPIVGTIVMIVAIVGKFISNFFSETPEDNV
jgi:hypothetical protein